MRKIGVVTGTRAEYGLLKPLIYAIKTSSKLKLQLLVTGMHLSPEFGNTYQQIEEDGFQIDAKIHDGLKGDTAVDVTHAVSKAMAGFADAFDKLQPDIVVVLGDRSELVAAASAAIFAGIPIAHIHGGEITEGAYDEFIRHAITKMSHLHFTAAEEYRKRVIQLGEHPNSVFNVGALGIDSIKNTLLLNKIAFEDSISTKLDEVAALITFHPVTLEKSGAKDQFKQLLLALDTLEKTTLIFTKPNSDRGGRIIIELIDDFVSKNKGKAVAFQSLGQLRYLSALQHVDFVIGNSSSGIFEAPYFNIATINIGDRQKGRLLPKSVVSCKPSRDEILNALNKIKNPKFVASIKTQEQIFGDGNATERIVNELVQFDTSKIKKTFYNLKPACFEKL